MHSSEGFSRLRRGGAIAYPPSLAEARERRPAGFTAIRAIRAIMTDGSRIQRISLCRTARPRAEKNPTPIGETWIGRHGKKKRWLLNGAKNATPRPPLVSASSSPWEAMMAVKYTANFRGKGAGGRGQGAGGRRGRRKREGPTLVRRATAVHHSGDRAGQGRERQRVRQPAMAQHVVVADAEREADHVDVRQHRAHRGPQPEPPGQAPPREPLPPCGGCDGVGEDCGHRRAIGSPTTRAIRAEEARLRRPCRRLLSTRAHAIW